MKPSNELKRRLVLIQAALAVGGAIDHLGARLVRDGKILEVETPAGRASLHVENLAETVRNLQAGKQLTMDLQ